MDSKKRVGLALCGSYCTYDQVFKAAEGLAAEYALIPIMSDTAAGTDTRFGRADDHIRRLMTLTGRRLSPPSPRQSPWARRSPWTRW